MKSKELSFLTRELRIPALYHEDPLLQRVEGITKILRRNYRSSITKICLLHCLLKLTWFAEIDTVHRILVNFSQQGGDDSEDEESMYECDSPHSPTHSAMFKVAKLVVNYLAEIAPNSNLDLPKFLLIAEALPSHACNLHDGLYRAIDLYLKAHQGLSDSDKKKFSLKFHHFYHFLSSLHYLLHSKSASE